MVREDHGGQAHVALGAGAQLLVTAQTQTDQQRFQMSARWDPSAHPRCTYVRRAGVHVAVHGLQLGVVEQGLQIRAGEALRRGCQRFQLHVSCHGNARTQSLQDLQPSLLQTSDGGGQI